MASVAYAFLLASPPLTAVLVALSLSLAPCPSPPLLCCMQVKQQLSVYGSGESNYYYQLQRFVADLKVLEDKQAPKE